MFRFAILVIAFLILEAKGNKPDSNLQQSVYSASSLKRILWPQLDLVVNLVTLINTSENISMECKYSADQLAKDLKLNKLHAFKMLDASGLSSNNFLDHGYNNFGNYHQCLAIKYSEGEKEISGNYCRLNFDLQRPLTSENMSDTWMEMVAANYRQGISSAICVPSSCSQLDLKNALETISSINKINITSNNCESKKSLAAYQLPSYAIISGFVLSTWVTIVIVSTLMKKGKISYFLKLTDALDLVNNSNQCFAEFPTTSGLNLKPFAGFRFLYLNLNIVGHLALPHWVPPVIGKLTIFRDEEVGPLINLNLVSFNMAIGGFLAYNSLHLFINSKKPLTLFYFLKHLARRYLRVIPPAIGLMLIILATPANFALGPFFREGHSKVVQNCVDSWWRELTLTSNYVNMDKRCLMHNWLSSADMHWQFVILAFIPLVRRKELLGFAYLLLVALLCLAFKIYQIVTLDLDPLWTQEHLDNGSDDHNTYLYTASHNLLPTYLAGFMAAYFSCNRAPLASKSLLNLAWLTTCLLLFASFYSPSARWLQMVYSLFGFLMFGSIFILFYYCAAIGTAPIALTNFMSSALFRRLERFSYSTFLGHFLIIWHWQFTARAPHDFVSGWTAFSIITAIHALSLLTGFVLHLLFEAPFLNLSKLLFTKYSEKKEL